MHRIALANLRFPATVEQSIDDACLAEGGMHRFVWNLHYPRPEALETEFPISAIVHDTPEYPLGAWALPGKYSVRLTVDGKSYTEPLMVKMDPRIRASLDDLRKQHDMEVGAVEGMNDSYESLGQVQSVRAQLKDLSAKTGGNERLSTSLAALDKQCAELEGATQPGFFGTPPSGKQGENFSTLNQHFSTILAVADSADVAPTTEVEAAYRELEDSSTMLRKRWSVLREREILDLNAELKKAGLPEIDPKKPLPEKPVGASGGEDEP